MAFLVALQVLTCARALAAELPPDLRALIEGFQAHRRVAASYLRNQNVDLGAVEIERLRERWSSDRGRLSPVTTADGTLTSALGRTEAMVADSLKAVDGGDAERSRQFLEDAGKPLDDWRKDHGIRLFSDCIAEIGAAYGRLDRHRLTRPDLANRSTAGQIAGDSRTTIAALDRCEREARDDLRREPEFRRLFDGMRASLRQMPDALSARDGAFLRRLLIEQRSFERLLWFHFG